MKIFSLKKVNGLKLFSIIYVAVVCLLFMSFILIDDSFARAGGGKSFGSRGSRSSFSAPSNYTRPSSNRSQQPSQLPSTNQPQGGGFLRNLATGVAGGFLGSMLFSSFAHAFPGGMGGMGGGFGGLIMIAMLAFAAFFIFRLFMSRRNSTENNRNYSQSAYQTQSSNNAQEYTNDKCRSYNDSNKREAMYPNASISNSNSTLNHDDENDELDVDSQLQRIQQFDRSFSPQDFKEFCVDRFFNIQAAWMNRDLGPIRSQLNDEVYYTLEQDLMNLKNAGHINRVENVAVRKTEFLEVWSEQDRNFITLSFCANVLDYTVDERNGQLISGSKTSPVKFEEIWTYSREIYSKNAADWKLTAIQQITN